VGLLKSSLKSSLEKPKSASRAPGGGLAMLGGYYRNPQDILCKAFRGLLP
jgi:hypothetical protein